MPRTQDIEVLDRATPPPPPFVVPWSVWAETKLAYPREIYRGNYYRLTGGQEDHYKALREGWQDEPTEGASYSPLSSSPEALEAAKAGLERLRAEKAARDAKTMPPITKDIIAQMIEEKFAKELGQ